MWTNSYLISHVARRSHKIWNSAPNLYLKMVWAGPFVWFHGMFLFWRHSMLPMPLKPSTWRSIWNMTPPRGAGVLKSSITISRVAPLSIPAFELIIPKLQLWEDISVWFHHRKGPGYHLDLFVRGAITLPACAVLGLPLSVASTVCLGG